MKIKKVLSILIILQLFIVFFAGNNLYAEIATSKNINIDITADDTFDLYVNGTYIGSNTTNWRSARNFSNIKLLPGKNVIAVHCKNTILNSAGLNAVISPNYRGAYYTNSSWKVTRQPSSDWTSVDCNDSGWANATDLGQIGAYPWTDPISNYYSRYSSSGLRWIWMGDSYEGDDVYFRYTIDSNNMGSTLRNDAETITGPSAQTTLHTNEYLQSDNGIYKLILQSDGNLVLYNNVGRALWDTCTNGHTDINRAVLQWDENFVLYGTKARWDTCTNMNGSWSCWLVVQDDGNIVIYEDNHHVVWSR